MTTASNVRRFTKRKALLASAAVFGLFAVLALTSSAQEVKKEKAADENAAARSSIEMSGYTRPGNPSDKFTDDGVLIRQLGFEAESVKKFKIMGGTVYFAVFKNTGLVEGDTFGTGMANFDAKFETGRSFKDSMSPRLDRKARYLYLYQVVNDRNLDPRVNQVKGAKDGDKIKMPVFDPNAKIDPKLLPPVTEEIASFSLKLIADPRYITSWGHFRDSSFAANVVDVDGAGKPLKAVVDKVEREKIIHLSFSHLPAIVTELPDPAFSRRARAHSLGKLEAGFGVDKGSLNIKASKGYSDIKLVADQGNKDNAVWAAWANGILKATETTKEPDYVQLMYLTAEERAALSNNPIIPGGGPDLLDDDITRAIFRVDWRQANVLRQGARSVTFGFTTDLPPVSAPIRIDTPKAAAVSQGMRLANYFSEDVVARGVGAGNGIALTAGVGDAAALALAVGTALATGPTPAPAPAEAPAAGFAGMTGGMSGLGGTSTGGGGGGGLPGLSGGAFRGIGSSAGFGGGTGNGGGTGTGNGNSQATPAQSQAGAQSVVINFAASLTNQQAQAQAQAQAQLQFQNQNQNQNQNQHNHNNHEHHNNHHNNHHHGHVVPAPTSLFLSLLGLPGLLLLRRRKASEATPESMEAIA